MPVLLFVAQVLGVDADDLAALVTVVGEHVLVALDAVGVVIPQDVPVPGEAVIAVMAEHVSLLSCFSGNYWSYISAFSNFQTYFDISDRR